VAVDVNRGEKTIVNKGKCVGPLIGTLITVVIGAALYSYASRKGIALTLRKLSLTE
jgi:hypothetical protein